MQKNIMIYKYCLTVDLLLQNCGAATVVSQNKPAGHVDVIDVFGVGLPKHRAYVVESVQAKRPSGLHIPQTGAQSNAIDGLLQTSAKSLHAVFDGQVKVGPFAVPFPPRRKKNNTNKFIRFN